MSNGIGSYALGITCCSVRPDFGVEHEQHVTPDDNVSSLVVWGCPLFVLSRVSRQLCCQATDSWYAELVWYMCWGQSVMIFTVCMIQSAVALGSGKVVYCGSWL